MRKLLIVTILLLSGACSSVPEIVTERIALSAPDNADCRDNALLLADVLRLLRYRNVRCVAGKARPTDYVPHAWVEFRGDDGNIYIADPAALMTIRSIQYNAADRKSTIPGGPAEYVIARNELPGGYYAECAEIKPELE